MTTMPRIYRHNIVTGRSWKSLGALFQFPHFGKPLSERTSTHFPARFSKRSI